MGVCQPWSQGPKQHQHVNDHVLVIKTINTSSVCL